MDCWPALIGGGMRYEYALLCKWAYVEGEDENGDAATAVHVPGDADGRKNAASVTLTGKITRSTSILRGTVVPGSLGNTRTTGRRPL